MRPATLLVENRLLNKISQKYILGIITGAKKPETWSILERLDIKELFDTVITADDLSLRKPNPDIFPKVNIVAYIGDQKKDEVFAKNGGVAFFRVNNKYNINQIIKKLI